MTFLFPPKPHYLAVLCNTTNRLRVILPAACCWPNIMLSLGNKKVHFLIIVYVSTKHYFFFFSKLHGTTESVYSNAQPSLRKVEVDVHALLFHSVTSSSLIWPELQGCHFVALTTALLHLALGQKQAILTG